MTMRRLLYLSLLPLLGSGLTNDLDATDGQSVKKLQKTQQEGGLAKEDSFEKRKAKFILKSHQTVTFTNPSFFTSTVPYTCFSYASPLMACTGRRRRSATRIRKFYLDGDSEANYPGLEGSLSSDDNPSDDPKGSRKPKFIFTYWKKTTSATTLTVFSTNRSLTVSVSAYCSPPGVSVNAC